MRGVLDKREAEGAVVLGEEGAGMMGHRTEGSPPIVTTCTQLRPTLSTGQREGMTPGRARSPGGSMGCRVSTTSMDSRGIHSTLPPPHPSHSTATHPPPNTAILSPPNTATHPPPITAKARPPPLPTTPWQELAGTLSTRALPTHTSSSVGILPECSSLLNLLQWQLLVSPLLHHHQVLPLVSSLHHHPPQGQSSHSLLAKFHDFFPQSCYI